jgi:uncharacterized protein (TIGR00369 family)
MRKDKDSYIAFFLANDRFGALFNAKYISLSDVECVYEYEVSQDHFNPGGILHGGALYGVMDSCQGMLMHYALDESFKTAVTGTASIKYLAPVLEGTIRIRTHITDRQNRKFFVNSTATDANGKDVAVLDEIWIGIAA